MVDYFFRIVMIIYIVFLGIFLYLFGQSPPQLVKSSHPQRSLQIILLFFLLQFSFYVLGILVFSPFFYNLGIDYYYVSIILSTFLLVIFPLFILTSHSHDSLSLKEIGFSLRHLNKNQKYVVLFAIFGYFFYGILRILFLEPPPDPFWWFIILLMLYSNAFVEEFFGRAFIQLKLESIYGINRALVFQTILFVLIHIPSNFYRYFQYPDLLSLIIFFLFQLVHGFVYGTLYWKTRSIYPSVIVHFLTNWMGPIYFLLFPT